MGPQPASSNISAKSLILIECLPVCVISINEPHLFFKRRRFATFSAYVNLQYAEELSLGETK